MWLGQFFNRGRMLLYGNSCRKKKYWTIFNKSITHCSYWIILFSWWNVIGFTHCFPSVCIQCILFVHIEIIKEMEVIVISLVFHFLFFFSFADPLLCITSMLWCEVGQCHGNPDHWGICSIWDLSSAGTGFCL